MAAEYPGARDDLVCPDCGARMPFVPNRWEPGKMHYCCEGYPVCVSTMGAHPDGTPLGTPAPQETRRLRIQAHRAFDDLWKGPKKRIGRKAAYRHLQGLMGMTNDEAHIGNFDAEQCQRLIGLLKARNGE